MYENVRGDCHGGCPNSRAGLHVAITIFASPPLLTDGQTDRQTDGFRSTNMMSTAPAEVKWLLAAVTFKTSFYLQYALMCRITNVSMYRSNHCAEASRPTV